MNQPAAEAPATPTAEGTFIGISVEDNKPVRLFLLPGAFQGNWKDATAWAAAQGGALPSRFDALVLFERAPAEFEKDWYWTGTQYAGYDACAWYQSFDYGNQDTGHKDTELRARAVRRLPV